MFNKQYLVFEHQLWGSEAEEITSEDLLPHGLFTLKERSRAAWAKAPFT